MSALPKHVSTKIINDNTWWQYKCDEFRALDGTVREYYYAETRGAVFIIPILPDGRVVMVEQYRYLERRNSLEFPGGGIKPGQTPGVAAAAELVEESGAQILDLIKIGEFEPSNGFVRDRSHIFVARISGLGAARPDDTEVIQSIKPYTPSEVTAFIADGTCCDGQTIAAWGLAVAKKLVSC